MMYDLRCTIYDLKSKIVNLKLTILFIFTISSSLFAQNIGEIHGNFYSITEYYNPDNAIGATPVPEKVLTNDYANIDYTLGGFSARLQYEAYLDPILGYDTRYTGSGIAYKSISYVYKNLTVTAGNFYEQFGSGLIFRSYEDKDLGYDNSMDGISIRFVPFDGITLKGIIGKQRYYWTEGDGIVRGLDAEFNLNELFPSMNDIKPGIILGGSVVSKYEQNNNPTYNIPQNVAAGDGRILLNFSRFHFEGEYVYKANDPYPSVFDDYNFIYRPGQALFLTGSYNQKGLGILVSAKRIDNMNFRSQNDATGNDCMINYLPPLTIQHDYILENFFPYATQANGEMGIQGQVMYNFKKGSALGGDYGTDFMINYSRIQSISQNLLADSTHEGYTSNFLKIGNQVYYQDAGFEVSRKLSPKIKVVGSFMSFIYNNDIIKGFEWNGNIYGNVAVADVTYKLSDKKALRMELQHLYTEQYKKSWVLGLLEYSISPNWVFSIYDEYNYGNSDSGQRLHYYNASFRYTKSGRSLQLMYGRTVEGVICIGGVCRYMPASDGLTAVISCSF